MVGRAAVDYRQRAPAGAPAQGFDPDVPVAGLYKMRLVSRGHPVAIKIWHGAPLDPVTGEELDRGWRWQATANGRPYSLEAAWPKCAGDPIDQTEADYLTGLQAWAEKHAPDSPQADPNKRVDLLTAILPF